MGMRSSCHTHLLRRYLVLGAPWNFVVVLIVILFVYLGAIPDYAQESLLLGLGGPTEYQRLNPDQPCARQSLYPQNYLFRLL